MQPPAEPVPLTAMPFPSEAGGLNLRNALPSALSAGVAIGIASMVPFGSLAWIVLVIGFGGALCVVLYKRRHPLALHMRAGEGAKLGALASLFGYVIFAIVTVLAFVFNGPAVRQEVMRRMQEMKNPDPAMQHTYDQMMQKLATPEGMALMITVALVFLFVFFLVLGAAGGAIGATLTHRDRPSR